MGSRFLEEAGRGAVERFRDGWARWSGDPPTQPQTPTELVSRASPSLLEDQGGPADTMAGPTTQAAAGPEQAPGRPAKPARMAVPDDPYRGMSQEERVLAALADNDIQVKGGVDLVGVEEPVLDLVMDANDAWKKVVSEARLGDVPMVLTSGVEGKHGRSSFHPHGYAVDIRAKTIPKWAGHRIVRYLNRRWGQHGMQAVYEDFGNGNPRNHIHVELDTEFTRAVRRHNQNAARTASGSRTSPEATPQPSAMGSRHAAR